jgi:hypothetical protein
MSLQTLTTMTSSLDCTTLCNTKKVWKTLYCFFSDLHTVLINCVECYLAILSLSSKLYLLYFLFSCILPCCQFANITYSAKIFLYAHFRWTKLHWSPNLDHCLSLMNQMYQPDIKDTTCRGPNFCPDGGPKCNRCC